MKRWFLVLALAAGTAFAQPAVKVERPWVRPIVAGQSGGGGFVTLTSPTGDRLLGGSTPVAGRVEMHEMKMDGNVMRMREVKVVELPAGRTVKLEPGGLHLMFMGPKRALKAGETVALTLRFEKAGEVKLEVPVSATAP